jgi:integrase
MYLYALSVTGARPGEVARVTAADVDLGLGIWRLAKHKTAKRTGKPRIIVLTPPLRKLTARLVSDHPTGPLFPNTRGKEFSRQAIRCRFRRIRQKLGLGPSVVAYTLRHTWVTDALVRGEAPLVVAELAGHRGLRMIENHYNHLAQKIEHLREAAIRATQPAQARTVPLGKTG